MHPRSLVPALTIALCASLGVLAQTPSSGQLASIQAAKMVRVCIWPDYYGISYRNPRTQALSGIEIDLAQELGKDLGVAVQFIDSSFAKLIEDVTQNRCDVAMFAIGITPQRSEKLRFTKPHLASDMYAVTTKTNRRIKDWGDIDKPGSIVAGFRSCPACAGSGRPASASKSATRTPMRR